MAAARSVFALRGYSESSIDEIAAAAVVSTRTIYKHFGNKSGLFAAVIRESATEVAKAHIKLIERHLGKVTDLEAALCAFAINWGASPLKDEGHFALTRLINAEREVVPLEVIEAWQEAGPLAVLKRLGERFCELGLHVGDPVLAAVQFVALVTAANPSMSRKSQTEGPQAHVVEAGVQTFLHGVSKKRV